ncbi:MAG TPA: NAD-dependent epimerase/dehydratase family protein [Thermoanaerobaculia bacterium]|nr:NAD-dependent epimerase/dehydratase family protein [Thermoanaerobaculia bacterium]
MQILVFGGTQFIGRHLVAALLAAGHRVSVLNRGRSPDELPDAVERLRGDRDLGLPGLEALAGRTWDAAVDVSGYTPRQVRPSAERLFRRVARYVFVSAVSVYGDPVDRPVRETHPRLPPLAEDVTEDVIEVNGETYGPLKVACEDVVTELYGDRGTLLRPQVVVGSHDPSGRYAYWVRRAELGGEMLAPGDGSDHLQVVDVRDLARFAVQAIEGDRGGSFNLAGPRLPWAEFLEILGAESPVWVPAGLLAAEGLTFLDLPLYRPEHGPRSGLMEVSHERASAAGLTLTAPATTARDMRQWLHGRDVPLALPPEREAALLRRARGR